MNQKSRAAKIGSAMLTPEQRSERSRKGAIARDRNLTPEARKAYGDRMRQYWADRRAAKADAEKLKAKASAA